MAGLGVAWPGLGVAWPGLGNKSGGYGSQYGSGAALAGLGPKATVTAALGPGPGPRFDKAKPRNTPAMPRQHA